MALIQDWLPPSRENYEWVSWWWQFFPLVRISIISRVIDGTNWLIEGMIPSQVTAIQWLTEYYPQGKTSVTSRMNIPGKIGWATMEVPGFIVLLYVMFKLPREAGVTEPLPWPNWMMAGMFVRPTPLPTGRRRTHG